MAPGLYKSLSNLAGGGDRGMFSTSTWPYLVVFYLYLTFSTATNLVSTSTNLVSISTDHFLAVSCILVSQPSWKQITSMQEWQSKIFLNYIALYLIQVRKFEYVITCLGCAKIIKHFASLLRFY